MAEAKSAPHEDAAATEERTEPFSQAELETRLKGVQVESQGGLSVAGEEVPLDVLQVEDHHHRLGIRLLVRPLADLGDARAVTPTGENCRWLAFRAEVASSTQPEHKVLAVTQTHRDIKFSVRIPGDSKYDLPRPELWCELYYDPASDRVILLNRSDVPISLVRISQAVPSSPPMSDYRVVNPGTTKSLEPGTWRIKVRDIAVLDFRILEKRPVKLYEQSTTSSQDTSSDVITSSGKRALTPDEDNGRVTRRRLSEAAGDRNDDGVVMFLRPSADPLVFSLPNGGEKSSKELSATSTNALLDAEQGDTVYVPGVCELDEYHLTRRDPIASTALSAVYAASYSPVPDNIVTVKVLKTRVPNAQDKPTAHEKNIIRQADMWQRESRTQENLNHGSIVRFYGGDARFLTLFMEHVDAKDLTSPSRWRNKGDDHFLGSRADARRILTDVAEALKYIHGQNLVHNDIKPANILYSTDRGGVLCDFGMSTPTSSPPAGGGTPYYIPPEFIGRKLRGPASDVWAMGITMLYLLRKIPLPESRGRPQHPKRLYWLIAGVNNPSPVTNNERQYGNGQPAIKQMRQWLTEVYDASQNLNMKDTMERVVKSMLVPNAAQRITMADILKELSSEQPKAS
ncbi:hypothetical protein K4F52_004007 [Lecanicillium sp. MT-2017a]|nr:hypothetical protein K4F52_004007 [Lecanicillium sp. MT-2017a]